MDKYIGKLLDNRYEILEIIGVGGMAMVYKAYCHRLHRFVAVKILRSDFASDAEFRRRFHDEAQAVAMLSHPNIVSVYDISRNDDLDYIVMELIDGITLKQYMKKKGAPLSWREALHYITQIMRALSHAHSRGIIHRDIKPQNIMVLRDGSVRVADFGIARVMSAAQNTLTQEALGSVHYISPEQARGSNIDERADIYSAGVVLYEMLTGRLPFEGDSPVSVAIQHISSIPLSPRDLNPEIPEALEIITLKAMASKIDRRYRNAEEMIRDLEEFRKNPKVNFDYAHHQDMMSAEEPTQIIDTGEIERKLSASRRSSSDPVPAPILEDEDYDYDYEDNRNAGSATGRRAAIRQKKTNLLPIIGVVSVFFIGVIIFLWVFLLSDLFTPNDGIVVESFLGQTLEEVQNNPEIMATYQFVNRGEKPSESYELGQILEQTPKAGTKVKPGDGKIEVIVYLSSGPVIDTITMIDLTNLSYQEALDKIEGLGLVLGPSDYEASDEIEKGNVVAQIPFEGEQVAPGTEVRLTLSKGRDIKEVAMPNLIGQTEAKAKKMLESDLKLSCKIEYFENSVEAAGKVFYQSIPSGQMVEEGSVITIYVSTGPATPEPNPEEPINKTKSITITLPSDRETVVVKVTVDGKVQFETSVNTANNNYSLTKDIEGTGKQMVRVFFNGDMYQEYEMDFNS